LFVYFAINSLVEYFSKKDTVYIVSSYYISIFLLFFLAAFRYETGGDYPGYEAIYQDAIAGVKNIEPLFYYYNRIIYYLFDEFQFVYIFISLFTISVINKFISAFSSCKNLSLLAYYCMFYFNYDFIIVRQLTAACFFLLGVMYGRDKKWFYYVMVFIAIFVHYSAVLLLPCLLFINREWDRRKLFFIFLVMVLLYILDVGFVGIFLKWILDILPQSVFKYKLNGYLFIDVLAAKRWVTGKSIVVMLFFIGAYVFSRNEKNKLFSISFNCVFLYLFLFIGMYEFLRLSNRVALYFSLFYIVLIPFIIKAFRKNLAIILSFIVLLFSYNYRIFLEQTGYEAYNPYQSYLLYKTFNFKSTGRERLELTNRQSIETQNAKQ
jgi:hypothetical protein